MRECMRVCIYYMYYLVINKGVIYSSNYVCMHAYRSTVFIRRPT